MTEILDKPNVYNVFDMRRCDFPPEHFDYSVIHFTYNLKDALTKWIETNCKGRYYLGKSISLDAERSVIENVCIGFEDPKELSYFMLACPYLKYN